MIEELEEQNTIEKALNDKREKSLLFQEKRFGISSKHKDYSEYKLRTLIELQLPKRTFKAKEAIVISHLQGQNKTVTKEDIKNLLGYNSTTIFNKLNSNKLQDSY